LRHLAIAFGKELYTAWGRAGEMVATGEAVFPREFGLSHWEYLAKNPAALETFTRAMAGSAAVRFAALDRVDWKGARHVVDVGGGNGTLLAAILSAHAGVRGTLVELAGPAAAAAKTLAEFGDRIEIVAGSFFEPLPAGADAYVLSGILLDWDDAQALAILRRCAEAAAPSGRVLVIEEGILGGGGHTEMNLRMLAFNGGRERTLADFEPLAAAAGLRLGETHRVTRYRTVLELFPPSAAREVDRPPAAS
jgi:SAM-dependent methyltransferase